MTVEKCGPSVCTLAIQPGGQGRHPFLRKVPGQVSQGLLFLAPVEVHHSQPLLTAGTGYWPLPDQKLVLVQVTGL